MTRGWEGETRFETAQTRSEPREFGGRSVETGEG